MGQAVMESLITKGEKMDYMAQQADRQIEGAICENERLRKETDIARTCHEVNRAYCQALGDMSQPTWEEAPGWQKESVMMGVRLHLGGEHGPEASHDSWMAQKLAEGWVYGHVKNPEKKEHPCMVPFSELPREQQAKDFIFRAVVHSLASVG
jgi:hypothetical protein